MADPRSSYNYITDLDERLALIKEQEGLDVNFKIDDKIKDAIEWYKKHTITTSTLLLDDTRAAVDKVRKFLREVDLDKTDKNGKPLYQVSSITTALKQVPQLAKDLQEVEKTVSKEIEEAGRMRGNEKTKAVFEDGF